MGIFFRLFELFGRNKPHKQFLGLYSKLNELALYIKKEAESLRKLQEELVIKRIRASKRGEATGGISLAKTKMVQEELIPKLELVADQTEKRFLEVSEITKQQEPFSAEEQQELNAITEILEKVKDHVTIGDISKLDDKEKLRVIESKFREIENLIKEFHLAQKYAGKLAREVHIHEIAPLIKNVFRKAGRKNNFSVKVTENEVAFMHSESEKINACQDPGWKIIWRRWYQEPPKPELDIRTGIKARHINVTMVLNRRKKDIHLLVA